MPVLFVTCSGRSASCQWTPESTAHDFSIATLKGISVENIQSASVHVCLFPSTDHHKHPDQITTTFSVGGDATEDSSAFRPADTIKSLDPASFRCINNRCGGRSQSPRRRPRLARRCGWQKLDITRLVKEAVSAGKDKVSVHMMLSHSKVNNMALLASEPVAAPESRAPEVCLSFMGSLPSFMPSRFLPFLSIVQSRSFLRAKTGNSPLPQKTDCHHETAKLYAKPCKVQTFNYTVDNYAKLLTQNITTANAQSGQWRIISPARIALNKCVGHCSFVTKPQRKMINFFELVGADFSDFTSKCTPTLFGDEEKVLFKARQQHINSNGKVVVTLVKESWAHRKVLACGCSRPNL